MAYTSKGFLGEFRGSIRNMIIYQVGDKTLIRSRPAGRKGPASPKLKAAQTKFGRVTSIVKAVKPFTEEGFRDVAGGRYVFQRALSENLARYDAAATPEDLGWLALSMGDRAGAQDLALTVVGNKATITWGAPEQGKPSSPKDQVLLLAINTTSLDATDNFNAGQRSKGQATIKLPPVQEGEQIRVGIAFRDLAGTMLGCSLSNISSSQWVE